MGANVLFWKKKAPLIILHFSQMTALLRQQRWREEKANRWVRVTNWDPNSAAAQRGGIEANSKCPPPKTPLVHAPLHSTPPPPPPSIGPTAPHLVLLSKSQRASNSPPHHIFQQSHWVKTKVKFFHWRYFHIFRRSLIKNSADFSRRLDCVATVVKVSPVSWFLYKWTSIKIDIPSHLLGRNKAIIGCLINGSKFSKFPPRWFPVSTRTFSCPWYFGLAWGRNSPK